MASVARIVLARVPRRDPCGWWYPDARRCLLFVSSPQRPAHNTPLGLRSATASTHSGLALTATTTPSTDLCPSPSRKTTHPI
ncbi:hypothetical protein C2E23DRAFT_55066 [Lenzites betulinus]|nr:hypothetical protein C2E23DRAFT_55066 [Lenzites betulinus]